MATGGYKHLPSELTIDICVCCLRHANADKKFEKNAVTKNRRRSSTTRDRKRPKWRSGRVGPGRSPGPCGRPWPGGGGGAPRSRGRRRCAAPPWSRGASGRKRRPGTRHRPSRACASLCPPAQGGGRGAGPKNTHKNKKMNGSNEF